MQTSGCLGLASGGVQGLLNGFGVSFWGECFENVLELGRSGGYRRCVLNGTGLYTLK